MRQLTVILLLVAGLAACRGPVAVQPEPSAAPVAPPVAQTVPPPVAPPAAATPLGATRYVIDADRSWLRVRVYKSGRLARFGHNHVMTLDNLNGSIDRNEAGYVTGFDLSFAVADLVVDDPAARTAEGEDFPGAIPDKDREGTRRNMLSETLLNATVFPDIRIRGAAVSGQGPGHIIDAIVTLLGQDQPVPFPVTVLEDASSLIVEGDTSVTHDELGLTPFSALLGALSVRDDIGLHYYIVATPTDGSATL